MRTLSPIVSAALIAAACTPHPRRPVVTRDPAQTPLASPATTVAPRGAPAPSYARTVSPPSSLAPHAPPAEGAAPARVQYPAHVTPPASPPRVRVLADQTADDAPYRRIGNPQSRIGPRWVSTATHERVSFDDPRFRAWHARHAAAAQSPAREGIK